jgi:uncharacterized paraquat-inducible protein A
MTPGKIRLNDNILNITLSRIMKAYIITLIGITLSIISFILYLTVGQIYFLPLVFILPLSGTCFTKRNINDSNNLNLESIESLSQNSYKVPREYYYIIKCPNCEKIINEEHPKYCPHCGIELTQ